MTLSMINISNFRKTYGDFVAVDDISFTVQPGEIFGLLIGVVSPSTRMTVLYSQIIFILSMILGGLMLPYSMLPEAAQTFAQLMPATHAMNAFNGLAMGAVADFNPWASVVMLASSGILAFGMALYLFSWDSKNSQRRGHPALALLAFVPYVVGILFL